MTQRKTTGHCCPAVCQLRAFPGLAFRHKDYLPIPGPPPVPTQQPSPSSARDAALPTTAGAEAPLAPHHTKDWGSCRTARSFLAPTVGLALGHVLFPSLGQAHGACSTLAQQALSLQMVTGVGFGMLHLKLRGQKGQEEHRVTNVMLKQQLQSSWVNIYC